MVVHHKPKSNKYTASCSYKGKQTKIKAFRYGGSNPPHASQYDAEVCAQAYSSQIEADLNAEIIASLLTAEEKAEGWTANRTSGQVRSFNVWRYSPADSNVVELRVSSDKVTTFNAHHLHAVLKYNWMAKVENKQTYVIAYDPETKQQIRLHRLLLPDTPNVDHKSVNALDNTDDNLRPATPHIQSLNRGVASSNTSGVTGVSYSASSNSWRAIWYEEKRQTIVAHRCDKHLKRDDESAKQLAVAARKAAAERLGIANGLNDTDRARVLASQTG